MANCKICGRALKNPKWVALGVGPICAGKLSARTERQPGIFAAQYELVQVNDEAVWIRDVGRDCRSVTNDAEAVVAELAAKYGPRRIIYQDSMGRWDELKHEGAVFTGYAPAANMAPQLGAP